MRVKQGFVDLFWTLETSKKLKIFLNFCLRLQPSMSSQTNYKTAHCEQGWSKFGDFIQKLMIKQIKADLIVGRCDENLEPYSRKQILEFLEEHAEQIDNALLAYLKDAEEDFEEMQDPMPDLIREYLYEELPMDKYVLEQKPLSLLR